MQKVTGRVCRAGLLFVYLRAAWVRGVVRRVPDAPGLPDDVAAGPRAANARLRELLAERDAQVDELLTVVGGLREQVAELQAQVADLGAKPTGPQGPWKP